VGMIGHTAIFYRQQKDPEKRKISLPKRKNAL
jgi:RNA-binding protein YhbY